MEIVSVLMSKSEENYFIPQQNYFFFTYKYLKIFFKELKLPCIY